MGVCVGVWVKVGVEVGEAVRCDDATACQYCTVSCH